MRKYLLHIGMLMFFMSCMASKPPVVVDPEPRPPIALPKKYIVTWKSVGGEQGVVSYQVQKSKNNRSWTAIKPVVLPRFQNDSNVYHFLLPTTSVANYYKITATVKIKTQKGFKDTVYTAAPTRYLPNTNAK